MAGEDSLGAKGVITDLVSNLEAVFRHVFPGVLVLAAAYSSHPSWFHDVDLKSWPTVVIGAVFAFTAGSAWFAVNRFTVHQLVDYICYVCELQGPARTAKPFNYLNDLAEYVREALVDAEIPVRGRQHIAFRASSVLLLYTIAELSLLCGIRSEPNALAAQHSAFLISLGTLVFLLAIWQNVITRRIDAAVLHSGLVPRRNQ